MSTKSITVSALFAAIVLLASFAVVSPAFANVDLQDSGFKVNDKTSDTIQPGDDYEVTVNADIDGAYDNEVEFFRVRLYEPGESGDNWVSTDCQAVGRIRALNDENIRFNTETPSDIPNGPYDIRLEAYGIDGEAQSNGCSPDNDGLAERAYTGRLFVNDDEDIVGNSGSNSGGSTGGATDQWQSIKDALAGILAALKGQTPATPAPSSKCATLNQKLAGTMQNSRNSANIVLQGYLLSEGASIPALAAGASFGFYGPQTSAALYAFKAQNQCQ